MFFYCLLVSTVAGEKSDVSLITLSSQVICYFCLEACDFFLHHVMPRCLFSPEFNLSLGEPFLSAD